MSDKKIWGILGNHETEENMKFIILNLKGVAKFIQLKKSDLKEEKNIFNKKVISFFHPSIKKRFSLQNHQKVDVKAGLPILPIG